jgi:hypothetical protein
MASARAGETVREFRKEVAVGFLPYTLPPPGARLDAGKRGNHFYPDYFQWKKIFHASFEDPFFFAVYGIFDVGVPGRCPVAIP